MLQNDEDTCTNIVLPSITELSFILEFWQPPLTNSGKKIARSRFVFFYDANATVTPAPAPANQLQRDKLAAPK